MRGRLTDYFRTESLRYENELNIRFFFLVRDKDMFLETTLNKFFEEKYCKTVS